MVRLLSVPKSLLTYWKAKKSARSGLYISHRKQFKAKRKTAFYSIAPLKLDIFVADSTDQVTPLCW